MRAGPRPDQQTQQGIRGVVCDQICWDGEQDLAAPVLVAVKSSIGYSPGYRGTDIDEVSVSVRARSEDRVGEDDGVRFRPRDVFTGARTRGQLIGRARPR